MILGENDLILLAGAVRVAYDQYRENARELRAMGSGDLADSYDKLADEAEALSVRFAEEVGV